MQRDRPDGPVDPSEGSFIEGEIVQMDTARFDRFVRGFADASSPPDTRRQFLAGLFAALIALIGGRRQSALADGICNEIGTQCSNPAGNYTCCAYLGTDLGCTTDGTDLCCVDPGNRCDPNWTPGAYDGARQCCNPEHVCSAEGYDHPVCQKPPKPPVQGCQVTGCPDYCICNRTTGKCDCVDKPDPPVCTVTNKTRCTEHSQCCGAYPICSSRCPNGGYSNNDNGTGHCAAPDYCDNANGGGRRRRRRKGKRK